MQQLPVYLTEEFALDSIKLLKFAGVRLWDAMLRGLCLPMLPILLHAAVQRYDCNSTCHVYAIAKSNFQRERRKLLSVLYDCLLQKTAFV